MIQYHEKKAAQLSSTAPAKGDGDTRLPYSHVALELDHLDETLDHEWLSGT